MNREEYAFAYNINGTGVSGIITMTNPPKLVCYCDEENSKTILKALNPSLPPAEGAESAEAFIKRKHPQDWDEIPQWHIDELNEFAAQQQPKLDPKKVQWSGYGPLGNISQKPLQPTAEGAEEILASLIESLGEPDNSIHDHSYEIRPLTVNGKCEWWMFHNGVGSGEPLAQWLQNFAALHAQRIADKMVSERLREELIGYDKFLSNTYWGISHIIKRDEAVDEYLKTREK